MWDDSLRGSSAAGVKNSEWRLPSLHRWPERDPLAAQHLDTCQPDRH